ncbi:MAG: hypothetical protein LUP94_00905 [Candidatus Methanomethylicus sp.]|nr:hypothetical protein [Candidatus Methanomethylicus sp.]
MSKNNIDNNTESVRAQGGKGNTWLSRKLLIAPLLLMLLFTNALAVPGILAASNPSIVVASDAMYLTPGAFNDVTLNITNAGDYTASQVTLTITLPNSQAGGGVMILNGSDNKFVLGDIGAHGSVLLKITIYVSPSAASNIYQLTYTFSYQYGGAKTDTRILGYIVQPLGMQGAVLSVDFSQKELTSGQINQLSLTITNIGDAEADAVTASITLPGAGSSSPLTLIESDGKWIFGSIGINQSVIIPVSIFASPSSAGSVYQIPVALAYSDYIKSKQDTRYLSLGVPFTNAPAANIDVSLSAQDLRAGFTNNLTLIIRNVGTSTAESPTIALTLPGSQSTSSPYILIGSDGIWQIEDIEPGHEVSIPLSIFVTPAAASTGSTFSITTTYTDLQYKSKQQISTVGVLVRGAVDLVVLDSSTFPQTVVPGSPFSFAITLINLGTTTAQSVRVTPSGTDGITPFSEGAIFLGDLAVNVPSSLTISYMAGNVTNGTYSISFNYTYKNALGQQITDSLATTMKLTVGTSTNSSSSENQAVPSVPLSPIILFGLSIATIAVIAVLLIRRHRSGSKK